MTIADIVKFKKPKKGGKDTPRVAAPSGTKKFGTSAADDHDVDDDPIDTSSAAEPVVSLLLRKLRSTTRPENSEQEKAKRRRQESPLFVPNKDSDIEQYNLNTSKTIDLGLLNEKLLALYTNNSDKGDNILVDEQGLAGIQELQGVADYQDREFDNSDNEPVKDSLYAVDNIATATDPTATNPTATDPTATNLAVSRATSPTYRIVAVPNIPSFSNSTKAILYPRLVGPISDTKIALGI